MKSVLAESGYWAGYDYVANQSGGFWGFWYGDYDNETIEIDEFRASIYLQVETVWDYEVNHYSVRICLKISKSNVVGDDKLRLLRDIVVGIQSEFGFEKPSRLGHGHHITTGIFKTQIMDYDDFKNAIMKSLENYKVLTLKVRKKLKQDLIH